MNFMIILIAKVSMLILKICKRGSAYPGKLAIKLNKDILSYFKMPKDVIFVTGTTGKTTVSEILNNIYLNSNKTVAHNVKGSNLLPGVTTSLIEASNLFGKIKKDAVIIEIDERYVKNVFKYITPTDFIITNLSRDQLARNGHFDKVFNEINSSIKPSTHLFLNADDPLVVKFGLLNEQNKIIYYGLAKTKLSTNEPINTLDLLYCPKCYNKMIFDYFHYGNLGMYHCPNCSFKRPKPKYEAKMIKNNSITIENNKIKLINNAIYNIYNNLVCYAVAKDNKIEEKIIVNTLNNLNLKVKRFTEFRLDKVKGYILLSKNETPISYNQSLEYVKRSLGLKTVAIGFNRISGRYNLKDISWLYDINFELLKDESIKKILLFGPFAYDLAVRLKCANVDPKKIKICLNSIEAPSFIKKNAKGIIYCLFYFDMDKQFKKQLKTEGEII